MTEPRTFLEQIKLEQLDKLLFRGVPNQWASGHVFGGHVIAQAMEAAALTISPALTLHSMHCYFLRPGIASQPIIYDVDPIRNGRSFATRRVVAIQNGEAIFSVAFSYHIEEEGLSHQIDMPDIPPPETLEDDAVYFARALATLGKESLKRPYMPFETRSLDPMDLIKRDPKSFNTGYWLKLRDTADTDTQDNIRLLSYISDFSFLTSALRPHGIVARDERLRNIASLDHSLWLHSTDFDPADWLFYQTEGHWAGKARSMARGLIYTRQGHLIASTAQEALIRLRKE